MPNLVSLTSPICQVSDKTQIGVFSISRSLVKENCCNSRIGNDIDMKPIAITKLDKGNMAS